MAECFFRKQQQPWTPIIAPKDTYTYNGKEFNEDLDLKWSDYGARWCHYINSKQDGWNRYYSKGF